MRHTNWIEHASPKQLKTGTGWFGELDRVYSDRGSNYVVMIRTVETQWGPVEHVCIRNAKSTDIPWAEKQRIKNEIFGEERVAVEVFPKTSELVDHAMMYHLWVLPDDMTIPFGIN
ncbi:hypothetical protein ABE096_14060 [Robertmurraya massiliosenegalensis]|uniref:DUF7694 domain-containing protein n=1 Tax=Robertmurraya TaxID=2837507 RepID=UPI0039A4A85A